MSASGTKQTKSQRGEDVGYVPRCRPLAPRPVVKSLWVAESILGGCRPPQPFCKINHLDFGPQPSYLLGAFLKLT
jgi:hypothetical protein